VEGALEVPASLRILDALKISSEWLFPVNKGGRINFWRDAAKYNRAARDARPGFGPHGLGKQSMSEWINSDSFADWKASRLCAAHRRTHFRKLAACRQRCRRKILEDFRSSSAAQSRDGRESKANICQSGSQVSNQSGAGRSSSRVWQCGHCRKRLYAANDGVHSNKVASVASESKQPKLEKSTGRNRAGSESMSSYEVAKPILNSAS